MDYYNVHTARCSAVLDLERSYIDKASEQQMKLLVATTEVHTV